MFRRLKNLIKGFFSLFISGLEKRNPEALLEIEKENLRKQIAKYNKGLAAHAGLCEKLMSQVKNLHEENDELRGKITAYLKIGKKDLAGQLALRLQTIKRELSENNKQLQDAESTYKELIQVRDASVKEARKKIDKLTRGISDMKMKNAVAELNEMASGIVSEIGGSGDTLNRLHNMVEEERTSAAGRARVAKDSLDTTEYQVMAEEQEAIEQMALADFAAEEGIDIGSDAKVEKPAKTKEKSKKSNIKQMGDESVSE